MPIPRPVIRRCRTAVSTLVFQTRKQGSSPCIDALLAVGAGAWSRLISANRMVRFHQLRQVPCRCRLTVRTSASRAANAGSIPVTDSIQRGASGEAMTAGANRARGPVVWRERTLGSSPSTATRDVFSGCSSAAERAAWVRDGAGASPATQTTIFPGVTQQQSMWLLTTLALVQVQPPGPFSGCSSGGERLLGMQEAAGAIPVIQTMGAAHTPPLQDGTRSFYLQRLGFESSRWHARFVTGPRGQATIRRSEEVRFLSVAIFRV